MNKKKLLICCSLITVLLAAFSFPIYADETTPVDTGNSAPSIPLLDSYFTDNYDLLPYLESNGSQIIDTGINGSGNQRINCKFSYLGQKNINVYTSQDSNYINKLYIMLDYNDRAFVYFYTGNKSFEGSMNEYTIHNVIADKNKITFDNQSFDFTEEEFNINNTYKLFNNGYARIYQFSIYDYSTEQYVRYYYPAKSKASGIIGLYDAVSKTFITTTGSVPFDSPIDDNVMSFQIGSFLTSGLGWIGQIFDFVIEEPLILTFMAIGLAGVMFRWGRRLVHF